MHEADRALLAFLRSPRYEVMPLGNVEEQVLAHVPPEVTVTITASATRGLDATLDLAERLSGCGFRVVPHLAARLIRDEGQLREILQRARALAWEEVFVVAGDVPQPKGKFFDALSLLQAMAELGHAFAEVGIAGYPQSHPFIHDDLTIQAMWDKRRFATHIVSNLCFQPRAILAWIARVRRRGVQLPIHVGLAGAVDLPRLLRISARIGVGESARFVRWHSSWLLRLLVPGGYRPGRLVSQLLPELARPELGVRGFHLFTFNEVAGTERWRQQALRQLLDAAPAG